jgi:hypothetical protein
MRTIPVLSSLVLLLASLFVAIELQKPLAGLILLLICLLNLWLEVSRPHRQHH